MKIVYYDIETTDLQPLTGPYGVEIVQIGAVCMHRRIQRQKTFDTYLIPTHEISPDVTKAHGLNRGNLINRYKLSKVITGFPSDTLPINYGLDKFMNFLHEQKQDMHETILLVKKSSIFHAIILLTSLFRLRTIISASRRKF